VAKLLEHGWPGNVRELENVIAQAAALAPEPEIHAGDIHVDAHPPAAAVAPGRTLAAAVEDAERGAIEAALERHGGDLPKVARELGVSGTTLWRKMKRLGMGARAV
jgi:two-component system response regulator HydG